MWLVDWLNQNWSSIVAFVSSANFVALIVTIWKVVVMLKENRSLKATSEALKENLANIQNTKDSIDSNTESNSLALQKISELETELVANNRRIGAILDVMGIVYMRSKDEDVRTAVSTVINTIQYRDNMTVENLKLQVATLKEQLETFKNATEEVLDKSADVLNEATEQIEQDKIAMRG